MRHTTQTWDGDVFESAVAVLIIKDCPEPNAPARMIRALNDIVSFCCLNNPHDDVAVVENLEQCVDYAKSHVFLNQR